MSELNEFSRAELLLGKEGIEKLRKARVAVFGIGGVGSFAAEALARGGVGHLALVDGDVVSLTNINRQLIATQKTIGRRNMLANKKDFILFMVVCIWLLPSFDHRMKQGLMQPMGGIG